LNSQPGRSDCGPNTGILFESGIVDLPSQTTLIVAAAAVPAGAAAAFAAQRFSLSAQPPYWVMIAACLLLWLWAVAAMPPGLILAATCVLGWVLLVLAAVDMIALRLPDMLTLPLIAAGLAVSWWLPDHDLLGHAIGAAAGLGAFWSIATLYQLMRGQEGLGLGDMKLAGAAGAWLGWQALAFVVLIACAVGLVWVGIAVLRRGRSALDERIPFGVALTFAIWLIWLYGLPELLDPNI
jgi:leader peptidase (prepilin peptidase)/N-methyltransferase